MKTICEQMHDLVALVKPALLDIPPDEAGYKEGPDVWSKKEILGHLIDSASNNHKRFVLAQYKDDLIFDGYEQDKWVEVQKYNETDWELLINLWMTFNSHIVHIMRSTPFEVLTKKRTKMYAKRQLTWFKKEEDIHWVDVTGLMADDKIFTKVVNDVKMLGKLIGRKRAMH